MRRDEGRQNDAQNNFPGVNHKVIRKKRSASSKHQDFAAISMKIFLFEKSPSIKPLQNIGIRRERSQCFINLFSPYVMRQIGRDMNTAAAPGPLRKSPDFEHHLSWFLAEMLYLLPILHLST